MTIRKPFFIVVPLLILTAAVAFAVQSPPTLDAEGAEELAEMQAALRGRTEAQVDAEAAAEPWTDMVRVPAAPGWRSEKVLSKNNDWEPAVAADPSAPYVYILTTRYGADKDCKNCRHQGLALHRSLDGGVTFEKDWIWVMDAGQWQADPQIDTDAAGNVYVAILTNPFTVKFTKSMDHGVTWSPPVEIIGNTLAWVDHEWMVVSDDGQDIYVGFNHHTNYQTASHDGGVTWSEPILTSPPTEDDYYFSIGATILPNDDVVFAAADYACCRYNEVAHKRPVQMWSVTSTDGGASWTETLVGRAATAPECRSYMCPKAMFGGQSSVASDDDGLVMYVYSGGTRRFGPQRIWAATSSDSGLTWTSPVPISPKGVPVAGFPQIEGIASGDFRVAWADNRLGKDRFNIWYRDTTDGGATWSDEARLSNVGGGPPYKHPAGFEFFYGDYMDMAITNTGESVVVWSESNNYWGPGNTWWAVQE